MVPWDGLRPRPLLAGVRHDFQPPSLDRLLGLGRASGKLTGMAIDGGSVLSADTISLTIF